MFDTLETGCSWLKEAVGERGGGVDNARLGG